MSTDQYDNDGNELPSAHYTPPTKKEPHCDECSSDPSGNDYSFNDVCRNKDCPCHHSPDATESDWEIQARKIFWDASDNSTDALMIDFIRSRFISKAALREAISLLKSTMRADYNLTYGEAFDALSSALGLNEDV